MDQSSIAQDAQAYGFALAYIRTATLAQILDVRLLVNELEEVCMTLPPVILSTVIDDIMKLGRVARKEVSRDGALRCRRVGENFIDSASWIDGETKERFFNPVYRIYAKAIHYHTRYFPANAQIMLANWNDETVGDIVKYALGHSWRHPDDAAWLGLRNHLEQVCYKVITLDSALRFAGAYPRDAQLWAATVDELRIIFSADPRSPIGQELVPILTSALPPPAPPPPPVRRPPAPSSPRSRPPPSPGPSPAPSPSSARPHPSPTSRSRPPPSPPPLQPAQ